MLTIKKLKQIEKEFEGLNYEDKTFEKLAGAEPATKNFRRL
jgi:hypothetical protein